MKLSGSDGGESDGGGSGCGVMVVVRTGVLVGAEKQRAHVVREDG